MTLLDLLSNLRPRLSARQLRWFGCSCARLAWGLLSPTCREVVLLAERLGTGHAVAAELAQAVGAAQASSTLDDRTVRGVAWSTGPFDDRNILRQVQESTRAVSDALAAQAAQGLAPGESGWSEAINRVNAEAVGALNELLLDVVGPEAPRPRRRWPPEAVALAAACQEGESTFPILADALDDLGETEAAEHCRRPLHSRGCHVVEHILGRDREPPWPIPLPLLAVPQPWAELILRGSCDVVIADRQLPTSWGKRAYLFATAEWLRPQRAASQKYGLALADLPRGLVVGSIGLAGGRRLRPDDAGRACQTIRRTPRRFAWQVNRPSRVRVPFVPPVHEEHFRQL
jgi:hypothetical protein